MSALATRLVEAKKPKAAAMSPSDKKAVDAIVADMVGKVDDLEIWSHLNTARQGETEKTLSRLGHKKDDPAYGAHYDKTVEIVDKSRSVAKVKKEVQAVIGAYIAARVISAFKS